jgi:hypothetical protein
MASMHALRNDMGFVPYTVTEAKILRGSYGGADFLFQISTWLSKWMGSTTSVRKQETTQHIAQALEIRRKGMMIGTRHASWLV